MKDLKARLARIIVAYTYDGSPVTAQDIKAVGSMLERIPDKNGKAQWTKTWKYPIYDAGGVLVGMYGVGRDVSLEMELQSEAKYARRYIDLITHIPGGVAILHQQDGVFFLDYANEGYFSTHHMGSIYVTLIVKSTNDVSFGDYAAFTGKTVGILQDSADGASFRQWAKDRRMEVNIVEYPSTNDLLDVLDKGIVDAVAITNLGSVPGVRVVAEFCPLKMYFAFNKNCGELKKELDETMASLSIINPKFEFNLVQRYLSISLGSTPMLTEPEKAYVAGNPLVNVAVLEDDMICLALALRCPDWQ